jgi:serine/threonine-protein kinase ULK4
MKNYVIYDELGSDNHGVIYKGQRKGTIDFVSVHCKKKSELTSPMQ